MASRIAPPDHSPYLAVPVQQLTVGTAREPIAVHVSAPLRSDDVPLVCLAGYQRNMIDFTDFARLYVRRPGLPPLIFIDLRGRGRSADRSDRQAYSTLNDASDVSGVLTALGVEAAIFLGQGYGGQVIMALAAERPRLIAGAILIDAGPMIDSRGLVRLRNNMQHLRSLKAAPLVRTVLKRILAADYPGASEAQIEALALRSYGLDKRGKPTLLFDYRLIERLQEFEYDDVLVAQWPLFDALAYAPLLLMRTQLTDQLRREVYDEMMRRRPDALALVINGQGSPALLDHEDDVTTIARFIEAILAPETPDEPA